MKILNLYAGIGGNRKLWTDVDVTAIENNEQIASVYKDNFPDDKVIITDAHQYLIDHFDKFDFIWSSPPCPTHSRMMKATRHNVRAYPDMALYQEIIFIHHFFKGRYVIENVKPYYEPLIKPRFILDRHYFWSNFEVSSIQVQNIKNFITNQDTDKMKEWLGIYYEGNIYYGDNHDPSQVLRNCVNPEIGLHILNESNRDGLFQLADTVV